MPNVKKPLKIGQKIKTARKSIGYSQKDLAKVLKVTDKAVSTYEVGRAAPTLDTLRRISEVTRKPLTFFVEDDKVDEEDLKTMITRIESDLAEVKRLLQKRAEQ